MSKFYPVTPESSQKLRQAKLTAAEWRIWSYLIGIDPWGDSYKDVETVSVMSECEVSKATYYRAIAKFQDLEIFDFQDRGFSIRNLCGASSLKNEKPVSKMRQNSQNCENRGAEVFPSNTSNSSHTIQTISDRSDRSDDFEIFESEDLGEFKNLEPSFDEAIAEIKSSIPDALNPLEIENDGEIPKMAINPAEVDLSRRKLEDFILQSLHTSIAPEKRRAYFARFKPEDWERWEARFKPPTSPPVPRRDALIENPWMLENSIRQAIASKDYEFAREKIESIRRSHPDLAVELETKFFGGAA